MFAVLHSRTVAISWAGVEIRWYGVMYTVAFWAAYVLVPYFGKLRGIKLDRNSWTMLIVYGAIGVLVGGRLGYVFFYEPGYFLAYPVEIGAIWHGGMSSHGGFIGVALAIFLWARKKKIVLAIADSITVPAAMGLALGRIGNVINQEFGSYPSYEAVTDLLIAIVCCVLVKQKNKHGSVIAAFLILYSIARFLLEYIRPQEWSYILGLTRGQVLTIPLFVLGVLIWLYVRYERVSQKI